ncbi:type I secretion system permease/ATPase [Nostoc sp. CHAB 5834]|nr:type I secretion system permease/ATPase [Nostoc sp. CHAB 5834]
MFRLSTLGLTHSPELFAAISGRRGVAFTLFTMSAALNVLMLSGAIFMLLVYDEVLPSRSTPSLIGLVVLVIIAYFFQAVIEHLRNQVTNQCGAIFQHSLSDRVFGIAQSSKRSGKERRDTPQPSRDLDQLGKFLSGPGPMAILDLPWVLLFIGILFAFHVLLGVVSLIGAVVLILLTILTDRMTTSQVDVVTRIGAERNSYIETCRRNAELLHAMGMKRWSTRKWGELTDSYILANDDVSGRLSAMRAFTKTFRMLLQSLILACGAWLVINDRATGGVIIASTILSSRALAPIELAVGNWRGFITARQAWNRLAECLQSEGIIESRTVLPAPANELTIENLAAIAPGSQYVLFRDVNFRLTAGDALAIVGASGSGKSSLASTIVGIISPARGAVRLDSASLDQWDADALGQHIGFLPQDIELFDGSIAQNIARFDPTAESPEIIESARDAGVHELIVRLPEGYDTVIGPHGRSLSAGQRQRIALARALFRQPFLIVLDEPNSNLDAVGDSALNDAIASARSRGAIIIVVAHRPSALVNIDKLLWLDQGVVRAFGKKEDVLQKISRPTEQAEQNSNQIASTANA